MLAGLAGQPGCDVDLERPRNVAEIKLDERFTDLYRDIWACLRGEVEKSYARQD